MGLRDSRYRSFSPHDGVFMLVLSLVAVAVNGLLALGRGDALLVTEPAREGCDLHFRPEGICYLRLQRRVVLTESRDLGADGERGTP